ncbi:MFS transporter [Paraburkholderia sp. J63]|uniref:MFS transporter n=1 Tax=Paraburkholderia sp. J63 TaxID=2805434 RepID=UPI002ABE3D8A|nr:MFS transporter [Paraburkholderia sp. J63]
METGNLGIIPTWTRSQYSTLAGCALALIAGVTTVTTMTFGMFLLPVSETFGWARNVMTSGYGVFMIFMALGTPVVGRLIDRYDPRIVLGFGSALFAASTASLSFLTPSHTLLLVLYAVWGLFGAVQGPLGYAKIISAWFGLGRGLAMGLMLVGSASGTVIIPVLTQTLIHDFGWRVAYVGLGAVVLFISVPAIFLLVKRPPVPEATEPTVGTSTGMDAERQDHGVSATEAIRSFRFWFITASMFLIAAVIVGLQLHLFPILIDRKLSASVATTATTMSGLFMVAGRLLGGVAMDRFVKEKVAAFFFALPLGTCALLSTSSGAIGGIAAAAILGLCNGAEVAVASVLVAELFGLRAYGQIFSWIFVGFIAGAGVGPSLMAQSFVRSGSYENGLLLLSVFSVTASILTYSLGRFSVSVARRSVTT